MNYRLQQYEDGTFGYLGFDGTEKYNKYTDSLVVCTQGEDEDREEFIYNNSISFIKNQYGSNEKLDRLVNDSDSKNREDMAKQGYGLEKLVYDRHYSVREAVAKQGYGLDILVNDKYESIRRQVAISAGKLNRQDILAILINDTNAFDVRSAVARAGYGLEKLVNDENSWVRAAVADQGYGLDVLVNDKDFVVRSNVAEQGYGLDKLVKDNNYIVRESVAIGAGKEKRYDLLDILINDDEYEVRIAVAKQNYGLDKLIHDTHSTVRKAVAAQGYGLNELLYDTSKDVRDSANNYLKNENLTLEQWEEAYPEKRV